MQFFILQRNATDDGIYEIHSGTKDVSQFGQVASWNYENVTDWYEDSACNEIKGSQEAMSPPFPTEDRVVNLFTAGLCRSLEFTYENRSEVLGIPVHKFTLSKTFLADPRENSENQCFWKNKEKEFSKHPEMESRSGVHPMSICKKGINTIQNFDGEINSLILHQLYACGLNSGAPMVMSQPHFLGAAPYYASLVNGMEPKKEKHEMVIMLEDVRTILNPKNFYQIIICGINYQLIGFIEYWHISIRADAHANEHGGEIESIF